MPWQKVEGDVDLPQVDCEIKAPKACERAGFESLLEMLSTAAIRKERGEKVVFTLSVSLSKTYVRVCFFHSL